MSKGDAGLQRQNAAASTASAAHQWTGWIRTGDVQMQLGAARSAAVLGRTAVHSTVLHVHLAHRQRTIAQHLQPASHSTAIIRHYSMAVSRIDCRLRPRCCHLGSYSFSAWPYTPQNYVQIWRHPQNRKHTTYRNAARGGPSHDYR